jgi:hypothetical protein
MRDKIDLWRKLSSHLRPRGGVNLRKALIWDVEEGSVWGVKKIDLSFWDLDALVPSLSFVLAEIWKVAKTIERSFETSRRGRVEGLRKSTSRFETWMDVLAPWRSVVFAEIWGGEGNWALIWDFEEGSSRGAKKVDLSFWNR